MKNSIFNAIKFLIGLALIGLGIYSMGYGFAEPSGHSNLFFLGGFVVLGLGGGIIIYVIMYSKE